jgi:Sulfotransferase domain
MQGLVDGEPAARTCAGPAFIFIGPSKAGSSWFFEILREHPQVFVPLNKATFFFSDYYAQGIAWYEKFFFKAGPGQIKGEVCHDYLSSPEALRRIAQYRPDMRVICCLRNPYDRALSSWRFFRRNGRDEPSLAAQGERYPAVFEEGHYATHLTRLRAVFPQNQILILFFEDLANAPQSVSRRLYEFIGVDEHFQPPSLHKRVNVNATPRSRPLARFVQYVHEQSWQRSRDISNFIGQIKRIKALRRLIRMALYKDPVCSTDWREHLGEFPDRVVSRYEWEICALEKMLGRAFPDWRVPPAVRANLRTVHVSEIAEAPAPPEPSIDALQKVPE